MKLSFKYYFIFFFILFFAFGILIAKMPLSQAQTLTEKLRGRILLQVEDNGEAWYVNPGDSKRYYMGRPSDAFSLMRSFGVGITNKDLAKIQTKGSSSNSGIDKNFSEKQKGKILLQVESHGEAWYVYPIDGLRYYLGRPDDAFSIMRQLGLGITNKDLATISSGSSTTPPPSTNEVKISMTGGDTVYFSDPKFTRPEFCVKNNRAYLALRHSLSSTGKAQTEIALKIFDVNSDGSWNDITKNSFGSITETSFDADTYILYPANGKEGSFTDHQLVCDDDGFLLIFEAGGTENSSSYKQLVVYRFDSKWKLENKTTLFRDSADLITRKYKSDDPGAALLNNTLWLWLIPRNSQRVPTGFSMYGLDPKTLKIVKDDGNSGPFLLENPRKAAFPGVADFIDNEYHILTSPPVTGSTDPWSFDGLIDYRYDSNWKYLGVKEAEHSFGDSKPLYTTGRLHTDDFEIWAFVVEPPDRNKGNVGKTAAVNQYVNVGQAWVRIEEKDGDVSYMYISEKDTLGVSDDIRHIELSLVENTLYIGYKYLTDQTTLIKKYTINK